MKKLKRKKQQGENQKDDAKKNGEKEKGGKWGKKGKSSNTIIESQHEVKKNTLKASHICTRKEKSELVKLYDRA